MHLKNREGTWMSILFKNAAVLSIVVAFTMTVNAMADAAETTEQTYVKSNYITASKSTLTLGEGHEVTQEVVVSDIKYSNPEFTPETEWVYVHTDSVNGRGKQTGYYIDTHEDGTQTYGNFEGTIETTVKPDGSWESSWEGTYQYLGGTGKFENIKGNGKYRGQASSEKPAREEGQEVVDY
jgi:hypothetical protein